MYMNSPYDKRAQMDSSQIYNFQDMLNPKSMRTDLKKKLYEDYSTYRKCHVRLSVLLTNNLWREEVYLLQV